MDEYTPFRDYAVPDEITVDGRVYLDKEQLRELIRSEKRKWMAGTEKGYLNDDEHQRICSMLSLNRLQAILWRDEAAAELRRRCELLEKERAEKGE